MTEAYIALGSNQGDRAAAIRAARDRLAALSGVEGVRCSSVYETPAVSLEGVGAASGQGAYLNAAAALRTELTARELLHALLRVERELGRDDHTRRAKWGPRPMDLDLLLFGDAVIREPGLKVPHLRMTERWFVLRPLADLAPDLIHPTEQRSIAELLEDVVAVADDSAGIGKYFDSASSLEDI